MNKLQVDKESLQLHLQSNVLPDDISHPVYGALAKKYGAEVVVDFISAYDQYKVNCKDDGHRSIHVPTMKTITAKAHSRLYS